MRPKGGLNAKSTIDASGYRRHSLPFGLMLWMAWTDAIKPRLIPADDIDRVADDIIASYPDPEHEAFARHERAWYRSDGAEQTYWYRVRKAVRWRLERPSGQ